MEDPSDSVNRWWRLAVKGDGAAKQVAVRELERLGTLAAGSALEDLRHQLLTYRAGDLWVPTGGIRKEEMEIPPVITILLVGFTGSGKSSLVNLMYSVLGRAGLIPFAHVSPGDSIGNKGWGLCSLRTRSPSIEDCSHTAAGHLPGIATTMSLEEHNVLRSMRSGFCVYDSRGLDRDRVAEGLDEVSRWISKGVHHKQPCHDDSTARMSSKFVKRRVNYAMVVANMAEICKALKAGDSLPLEATGDLFCSPALRKCNENPILILTHGDKLLPEERMETRLKICGFLGISEATGAYDIVCLTEQGVVAEDSDPMTAYAMAEAVYRALLSSDRAHRPKEATRDKAAAVVGWLLRLLAAFFAGISHLFNGLARASRG